MSKQWRNIEMFTVMAGFKRGYTQTELADVLHRTSKAVSCKVYRMKRALLQSRFAEILERLSF